MKKLMIATAAIALGVSGAYATEGCCGTAAKDQKTCKANVYQVKMSLKTLVTKKVTKNGCTGLYFDQGSRVINGYIWTCCDPCGLITDESGNNVTEDYQITLWDVTAKDKILNGIGTGSGALGDQYTVTVKYTVNGVDFEDTLDKTYAQADVAQAANDYVTAKSGTLVSTKASKVASGTATYHWTDTDLVSLLSDNASGSFDPGYDTSYSPNNAAAPFVRYGKTAEKAAMAFDVVNSGYDLKVVGLGTFDKKSMALKSISGNVVGVIPSIDYCGEYAEFAGPCDDFETWCDYGDPAASISVPAMGTWTLKYVKKMGSLYQAVPSYDRL